MGKIVFSISALLTLGVVAFFVLISKYPILGQTVESADGSFKLQSKSTVSFFAFPGQGCDGSGKIKLSNAEGKLLYDSGMQFGLGCLPPHHLFPTKALILGKHEISETVFIDLDGQKVTEVTPSEFESVLLDSDDDDRREKLRFLGRERFGLSDDFLVSIVYRLLSTKSEKDFKDAANIASTLKFENKDAKFIQVVHQFIESGDHFFSRDFFDRLYARVSPTDYLLHLKNHYFARQDPRLIEAGLEILEDTKKISRSKKTELLRKYFDDPEPIVANQAMHVLINLGSGKEIFSKIIRRYYAAKDISPYYNMPDTPGTYLRAAFSISPQDPQLFKAIMFGLAHSAEAYWREAFYLVRDNSLNNPAFTPQLLALKAKRIDDPYLVEQVDEIVARAKK